MIVCRRIAILVLIMDGQLIAVDRPRRVEMIRSAVQDDRRAGINRRAASRGGRPTIERIALFRGRAEHIGISLDGVITVINKARLSFRLIGIEIRMICQRCFRGNGAPNGDKRHVVADIHLILRVQFGGSVRAHLPIQEHILRVSGGRRHAALAEHGRQYLGIAADGILLSVNRHCAVTIAIVVGDRFHCLAREVRIEVHVAVYLRVKVVRRINIGRQQRPGARTCAPTAIFILDVGTGPYNLVLAGERVAVNRSAIRDVLNQYFVTAGHRLVCVTLERGQFPLGIEDQVARGHLGVIPSEQLDAILRGEPTLKLRGCVLEKHGRQRRIILAGNIRAEFDRRVMLAFIRAIVIEFERVGIPRII